jgi:hypothetical protein
MRADSLQRDGHALEVLEVVLDGVSRQVRRESVVVDTEMGWALIQLASPIVDIAPAALRSTPVSVGEPVTLLSARIHREPLLSLRDTCVVEVSQDRIRYVVSQIAAAAAFAVVDSAWRVIAINVQDNDTPDGRVHTERCWTGRPIGLVMDRILSRGIRLLPRVEPLPEVEARPEDNQDNQPLE